jgi:hypothetical protein
MSTLRSAVEELQSDDLGAVDDDALETDLGEVLRAADLLHGEALRRIAEVERRGTFVRDGHLSVSSWLAQRFRMAFSVAANNVRAASALRSMPATRRALASGKIGAAALTALVRAREVHPDDFDGAEPLLVEAAGRLGVGDLRRAIVHWRDVIDRQQIERDELARFDRRRLHVSSTFEGIGRVDGDLDPETTEVLITALRSVMDAEVRANQDRRTPAQRRVDALGEICRQWLCFGDRPTVAGERPHVTVTVDLDVLEGRSGGIAELEHSGPVAGETARRIACDASITRVITRGPSEPLDVGRRTSVVSPALRRALAVRDGGCAFPGCDRPYAWCDAHHVRHWARGGETALSNLVLLCRPHHRSMHARGFGVAMSDGRPTFTRRDGMPLEDRAPPSG